VRRVTCSVLVSGTPALSNGVVAYQGGSRKADGVGLCRLPSARDGGGTSSPRSRPGCRLSELAGVGRQKAFQGDRGREGPDGYTSAAVLVISAP
jgi:hypothetical protein